MTGEKLEISQASYYQLAFGKEPEAFKKSESKDEDKKEENSEQEVSHEEHEDDDEDLGTSDSKTFKTITEMPFEEDECTTF